MIQLEFRFKIFQQTQMYPLHNQYMPRSVRAGLREASLAVVIELATRCNGTPFEGDVEVGACATMNH
jgi:hypothetical protein